MMLTCAKCKYRGDHVTWKTVEAGKVLACPNCNTETGVDIPADPDTQPVAQEEEEKTVVNPKEAEIAALGDMTVAQLKEYATANGFDLIGATRRDDIVTNLTHAIEAAED